jgi:2-oxoisovalerate dehydrogenase E1 component beta subunit
MAAPTVPTAEDLLAGSSNGTVRAADRPMVQTVALGKALNMGIRAAMERDPKVIVMGEDVGKLGGVFRITDGLQKDFGEQRVLDTPLSESGIIGTAIGLALRGFRPVCEIQFDGFVYPGFDQVVSQLAKMHYRSQGKLRVPVVVRVPYGGGIGAVEHHSESPESYFAHCAGLKVVSCSNPVDAYWMIQQAIECDDPVMFFEPKRRYWEKAELDTTATPDPLFRSRIVRPGTTATLAAYGPMVRIVLDAAVAAEDDGYSLEVIDLRTLSPLDLGPVFDSVRRTGHLVLVAEAPGESSITSEIAARVQQECFYSLEAPVLRVTGFDTPYPPSKCEEEYLPDLDRVLDVVDRSLAF